MRKAICQCWSRKQDLEPPTFEMAFNEFRDLIQDQTFDVQVPGPLLQSPSAMGNDANDFFYKAVIWCDFPIPAYDKFLNHNGDDGI